VTYCTVSKIADVLFAAVPSVAVTVMLYGANTMAVGTVVGVMVSVAGPVAVGLAWEVAVIVALPGRPRAIMGAVYSPVELIDPPFAGVTDQVTPVLLAFVTVAVNWVV